jgi:hypothetical protein
MSELFSRDIYAVDILIVGLLKEMELIAITTRAIMKVGGLAETSGHDNFLQCLNSCGS